MSKVTDWFPERGIKPVLVGLYEVCPDCTGEGGWWSWWNGELFGFFSRNPVRAVRDKDQCGHPNLKWRGLAEDPSKDKA